MWNLVDIPQCQSIRIGKVINRPYVEWEVRSNGPTAYHYLCTLNGAYPTSSDVVFDILSRRKGRMTCRPYHLNIPGKDMGIDCRECLYYNRRHRAGG